MDRTPDGGQGARGPYQGRVSPRVVCHEDGGGLETGTEVTGVLGSYSEVDFSNLGDPGKSLRHSYPQTAGEVVEDHTNTLLEVPVGEGDGVCRAD